jgi:hypothetical protein
VSPAPPAATVTGTPAVRRRPAAAVLGFALFAYTALLCAEFVSGSSPAPLLRGWNLLTYLPYYVVLVALIGRYGPLSVRSMYLFGAVLGLASESFVTKVVWAHPEGWKPVLHPVAGFGPWELATLVFAYHPLLSVVTPVLLAGSVFGTPYRAGLPTRTRRTMLVLLPVLAGAFASFGHQTPVVFAAALIVNAVTFTALIAAYLKWGTAVPRVPRWLLVVALVVIMGWSAAAFWTRYVPSPATVAVTLLVLAVLIVALLRSVHRDGQQPVPETPPTFRAGRYLGYLAAFTVIAAGCYALLDLAGGIGAAVLALAALAAGLAGAGYVVVSVVRVLLPAR